MKWWRLLRTVCYSVFCLVCLLNEEFPPRTFISFQPCCCCCCNLFSSVCSLWFSNRTLMILSSCCCRKQSGISCRSTKSLLAVFHCKSTNISDVSRLVFQSMNQVGGISCLRFYFPLLFTVAVFFCVCEIFQSSVCLLACGSPAFFLLSSDTDAIVFNSSVPSQQGGGRLLICRRDAHTSWCPCISHPLCASDRTRGTVVWACWGLTAKV